MHKILEVSNEKNEGSSQKITLSCNVNEIFSDLQENNQEASSFVCVRMTDLWFQQDLTGILMPQKFLIALQNIVL